MFLDVEVCFFLLSSYNFISISNLIYHTYSLKVAMDRHGLDGRGLFVQNMLIDGYKGENEVASVCPCFLSVILIKRPMSYLQHKVLVE